MVKPSGVTNDALNLHNLDDLSKARELFKESSRDIMKMAKEFREAIGGGDGEATYNPDSENVLRAPLSYMCLNFAYNLWCQTVIPTVRAAQKKFQPDEPQQSMLPFNILGGFPVQAQPRPEKPKEEPKEEPKGENHVEPGEREAEDPQD